MKGLHFNLIGVIKNASSLPQETKRILRENQSTEVLQDRWNNGWFARITFRRKEDGSFVSPITALTEKDMNYFLIQVVNTYQGSTIIVETGTKDKQKNIWVDERRIQRCDIGGGAGTVMRVSQNGNVEIHRVTSSTVDNKKQIKVFTLFEDNLPFEKEHLLNAVIADDEYLKEFGEDLKKAHAEIKKRKFENKMDFSEVKYRNIQNRDREIKKVEIPIEKEVPAELKVVPEPEKAESEPKEKPVLAQKAAPKKTANQKDVKKNRDEKKASAKKKRAVEKAIEKEAEAEIKKVKSFESLDQIIQ